MRAAILAVLLIVPASANGPFPDGMGPISTYHGAMAMHENTDAQTIDTAGVWHLVYTASDWATGDIMSGVTFEDGAVETVTGAYADAGGSPNEVTVTALGVQATGFANGDMISITGSTNYNGVFELRNIAANTFTIVSAYNAEAAAGTITRGGSLTVAHTGTYTMHYTLSMAPTTGNDDFDVALFDGFTAGVGDHLEETESRAESKLAGKYSNLGGGGIHAFTAGDKVTIALKNVSATNNVTVRYVNVWLIQI